MMDALQELREQLYLTAAEEFIKEYQDSLDSVRRNLAIYMDPCAAMSALNNPPKPISDNDHVADKKVDQLGVLHDRQLAEAEHILNYVLDFYLSRPGVVNADEIAFALERFLNKIQKATDSYTVKLGISPYQNMSPYGDSLLVMMNKFQHMQLKAVDCGSDGKSGLGATETKNEKLKREEKKRLLGVKIRLSSPPVLKTKKIPYCCYYIQGRCRKGEKCNFSHDTVPLTKSTPCKYLAHGFCMKGDDCPFDHELSKYPCVKHASNYPCPRLPKCLFSHEIVKQLENATES
ncbi:hypothetical protein ACP275_10G056900 [Erythranthe tilingii]